MLTPAYAPHIVAYDDDPDVLRTYGTLLAAEGYRVTLVRGHRVTLVRGHRGEPAVPSALQPDLIIVDLVHPHVALGSAVLAGIRGHGAVGHPAVLVCSGDAALLDDLGPQLRMWGWGVVAKPIDIDVFLAEVAGCIDRSATATNRTSLAYTAATKFGDGSPQA